MTQRPRLKVGLRATVYDRSVSKLPDIVRFFSSEFGSGLTIAFEPLVPIGRGATAKIGAPNIDTFCERFLEARRVGRALGLRVMTSGPSVGKLIRQYCGALAIPSFAVCTDGTITACHRDQDAKVYGYGSINSQTGEIRIDNVRLQSMKAMSEIPSRCSDCFAKWNCAGDCPDLRQLKWDRCEFNRQLLYDDLVELATQKGSRSNATVPEVEEPTSHEQQPKSGILAEVFLEYPDSPEIADGACSYVCINDEQCCGCFLQ